MMTQIHFFKIFFLAAALLVLTQFLQMLSLQHYSFDTLFQLGLFLVLIELGLKIKPAIKSESATPKVISNSNKDDQRYYPFHLSKIGLGTIAFSLILPNLV